MSLEAQYLSQRRRDQPESSGGGAWGPLIATGAFLTSLFALNLAWEQHQGSVRRAQEEEHVEYCRTIRNESHRDILGCPE